MSTSNNIKQLEQRSERLISELLATPTMIRGSFGTIHRKCGACNCCCVQAIGHPVDRINYSAEGRSRTKVVRAEDVKWAKQMSKNCKSSAKTDRNCERWTNKSIKPLTIWKPKLWKKTARQYDYVI